MGILSPAGGRYTWTAQLPGPVGGRATKLHTGLPGLGHTTRRCLNGGQLEASFPERFDRTARLTLKLKKCEDAGTGQSCSVSNVRPICIYRGCGWLALQFQKGSISRSVLIGSTGTGAMFLQDDLETVSAERSLAWQWPPSLQ